jgi:hypothetical protein
MYNYLGNDPEIPLESFFLSMGDHAIGIKTTIALGFHSY